MQRINKDIFKLLEAILPNKTGIYPAVADVNVRFPYVVYSCSDYNVERSKDGIEYFRMNYSVTVVSDKFDEADTLADSIISGMDGHRSHDIQQCHLVGGSSSFSDTVFYQSLDFSVVSDG